MPRRALITIAADGATAWLPLPEAATRSRPGLPMPAEAGEELVVVVPAEAVSLLPAPPLAGSRGQRLRAIGYAVEEQLAAPVETLHVALSRDQRTVAVVDRDRLQDWLAHLRESGLEPDRMIPEGALLAPPGGGALLWIDRDRFVLAATGLALACAPGQLAAHLALAPRVSEVYASSGSQALAAEAAACGIDTAGARMVEDAPAWLARRLEPASASASAPELLQGVFAPRRRHDSARRRWRLAAALAAAALLGASLHALAEHWLLQRRLDAQYAEMAQLYREVAPDAQEVPDPAAALRSRLSALAPTHRADALGLLASVAPLLAGSGQYTLDAVEIRGDVAELTLRAGDVAALDALRREIDALPGLGAELAAATPGANGAEGRLRVRRSGGAA